MEFFKACTRLKRVTLPAKLTTIDQGAFENCTSLEDVYFGNTRAKWESVAIAAKNDALSSATVHCSDD